MSELVYQTVSKITYISIPKIKWSQFIWYIFPLKKSDDYSVYIQKLRKKYHDATHVCYAYRYGMQRQQDLMGTYIIHAAKNYANDDGEPAYSAGKPILNVLQWKDLHNTLIAVIRYYGWTKLGIGGLIKSYTHAAKAVVEQSTILKEHIKTTLSFSLAMKQRWAFVSLAQQEWLIYNYKANQESIELEIQVSPLEKANLQKKLQTLL